MTASPITAILFKNFNFKDRVMNIQRNIGFLLLAIYLILVGINVLAPGILILPVVMGVLALVSGIFILIGR